MLAKHEKRVLKAFVFGFVRGTGDIPCWGVGAKPQGLIIFKIKNCKHRLCIYTIKKIKLGGIPKTL
jgi:hypothetical protein